MNNASIIYEKTEDYSDIQKFVDQKIPESIYLGTGWSQRLLEHKKRAVLQKVVQEERNSRKRC